VLTRRFDLFGDPEMIPQLRAEIDYWASTFSVPLSIVALDTVSARAEATRANTARRALSRAGGGLLAKPSTKVIGKAESRGRGVFYWWTGAPLAGFPETYPKPKAVKSDESAPLLTDGDDEF